MWILAGGCDRDYPDYWRNLSEVVLRELDTPAILSCMFSQDMEERSSRHTAFDDHFKNYFGEACVIEHAKEDIFYEQISRASIVYLHGGRTDRLLSAIPDIEKFRHAVAGKIVIGSSAGANFLSKACFSPSKNQTMRGSGLVPAGVVVHYGIDSFEDTTYPHGFWHEATRQVRKELGGELPLILLPEGQFVVIDNENH